MPSVVKRAATRVSSVAGHAGFFASASGMPRFSPRLVAQNAKRRGSASARAMAEINDSAERAIAAPSARSEICESGSPARMASNSARSSGLTAEPPVSRASFCSGRAWPERMLARKSSLIRASRLPLQIFVRQSDASRLPRRADGRNGLAIELEEKRAGICCRDFEGIMRFELLHFIRFNVSIEYRLAIGGDF